MSIKIAINGFGRIGRAAFKIINEMENIEVVAINDLTELKTLAHLLKFDSVYGKYDKEVQISDNYLIAGNSRAKFFQEKDPANLPWADLEVDVVLECTGKFDKDGAAKVHLESGAKKVVISAPAEGTGDIQTYLKGVNSEKYSNEDIISNASCTTNCISPVINIINNSLGVKKAGMTTIHAYTATQNLVDGPSKDPRRARAAALNLIPTTTGAAISTTEVIPELKGNFDGLAIRVPVPTGSLSDITLLVDKHTSVEEVNKIFEDAQNDPMYKGIIKATYEPIVSTDIIKDPHSAIVDLGMTQVIDGDLIKVLAWYDNEWGYSCRLVDMALQMIA